MIFIQKPVAASAGTNHVIIQLEVGMILRQVAVINETKLWQKETISLSEDDTAGRRSIVLVHLVPQPGNRSIIWSGSILMSPPFTFVYGTFHGCDADDVLKLTVGYDIPTHREPRRWW